ncbi:hypothetical protein BD626DRAFT_550246 [Schizophyllum amplum]|uniref:UBA domain-containing protein n=1 Tax=Schizophyllum amplum TaxID=97359 RepID=A0A550C3L3_9AGAR|nr:hypothetical protein BD626DRAFT_550246 [Auriculariopsis ampla]
MSTSFSPSPAELALVNQIFAQGDPQKLGVLTGDVAVRIFGGAKLQPATLGEIWNLSDEDNKGWLSKKGVAVAVRLMGWAQKGEKVSKALLSKPGPLPVIDGVSAVTQHNTGMSSMSAPKSPAPGFPPLLPADKTKFHNMFYKSGPVSGLLSGEKARDIFLKSKLPTDKLMQIWNLADTHDRGSLDATDFAIGMYFIQHVMSGQISFIPSSLPPGLYQQAGGIAPQATGSVTAHMTGGGSGFPAQPSPLPQQYTGHRQPLQPNMTGARSAAAPSLPARPAAAAAFGSQAFGTAHLAWDVTPTEKANSDKFFDTLDTAKAGFIEGDVAVPFMLQSNLPEDDLAQVWDLADVNNDGRLNRDGFAIAMHLIQKKLAGGEIPTTLPQSLIPPFMRAHAPAAPVQSPFMPATQAHPPPPQEPMRDLFNFDDEPPPTSMSPPLAPQATGGNTLSAQPTGTRQPSGMFTVPGATSAFMSPAPTQDPFGSSAASQPGKDLLDDDEEIQDQKAQQVQNQSVEIRNVQNQVESTTRSLDNTKNERVNLETTLADQAAQLSALQTQLSLAKAAYETETKLLSTLRERYMAQTAEIQKTREELIHAESDLSGMKVEKAEVEGSFLRDKEEARALHRKMIEAGHETEIIKAEIEKAKKEAKQQKGLLAIAKKQLGTKEADRAKAQKELDEAGAEVAAITREKEEAEAGIESTANGAPFALPERAMSSDSLAFAASHVLPVSPDPTSPVPMSGSPAPSVKSNNPFERLAMSPGSRSQSPFAIPSARSPPPASASPLADVASADQPAPVPAGDPFGFSAAFETPEPSESQATPKPVPADIIVPNGNRLSVDHASEFFTTPPSTAKRTPSPSPDRLQGPSAASGSPEATTPQPHSPAENVSVLPGAFPDGPDTTSGDADLSAGDSDSSDEDEAKAGEMKPAADATPATNGHANAEASNAPSFDDIFAPSQPASGVLDAFGAPLQTTASPFEAPAENLFGSAPSSAVSQDVSGVSAFDEAMGKVSPSGASPAPQFSFDSAFDDNFDFATAQATDNNPFPASSPVPASAPVSAFPAVGSTPPATEPAKSSNDFDAIFGSGEANTLVTPRPPKASALRPASSFMPDGNGSPDAPAQRPMTSFFATPQATNGADEGRNGNTSFDEAFSGFESGPSLKLDSQPAEMAARRSSETMGSPRNIPTQPSSPRGSEMSASRGKRATSPPPRVGSPRSTGRPSTSSSSKDGQEAKPQPTPRHSKLSKKKHSAPPPETMPTHLSPAIEEPRNVTPGNEDDVEPVKQLTSMGFSRTQAVNALETHGYDVPRALNSLLGAP